MKWTLRRPRPAARGSERSVRRNYPSSNTGRCLRSKSSVRRSPRHRGGSTSALERARFARSSSVKTTLLALPLRVEPEREKARHTGHHDVGHERDHHQGKDQRAQDRVKPAQQGIKDHEHYGGERKDRKPGHYRHLVARRGWISLFRRKREPGLEAGEDAYVGLLFDEVLGPVEPVAAFPGLFPALEVARVVELEDDLVLVVLRTTRADDVRSEVAWEAARRREDAGGPLLELPLAARLDAPRRHCRDGRVFSSRGSILFELVQGRYSNTSYCNTILLNPKPLWETTQQQAKDLCQTRRRQHERGRENMHIEGFGGRGGFGQHPALIVVDMTLGFTDSESPLGSSLDGPVEVVQKLLEAARRAEIPVVFTTVAYRESDRLTAAAFIDKVPALLTLEAGSRWAEIDSRISPRETEPVLNKLFASAFYGTGLPSLLAAARVDTLIVTGTSTSGCVRATAVDALQYGYRLMVPREAVGDRNSDAHEANLYDIDAKYGDVVSVEEALKY